MVLPVLRSIHFAALMESISDGRNAELTLREIDMSSANKKYIACIIEVQRSLISTLNNSGPREGP